MIGVFSRGRCLRPKIYGGDSELHFSLCTQQKKVQAVHGKYTELYARVFHSL